MNIICMKYMWAHFARGAQFRHKHTEQIHQVGSSTRTHPPLIIILRDSFYGALRLHVRAVKLVSPPTNPFILMLVHIRLGHIKPMINDVLIGLFSTKVLS